VACIRFLHPPRSTASPVFKPRARQSLSTTPTWIDVGRFLASLGRGYPLPSPHYTMMCHLYHLYLIGTTRGKAMSIEDAFRNFYRFFLFILLHCLCQYPVIANYYVFAAALHIFVVDCCKFYIFNRDWWIRLLVHVLVHVLVSVNECVHVDLCFVIICMYDIVVIHRFIDLILSCCHTEIILVVTCIALDLMYAVQLCSCFGILCMSIKFWEKTFMNHKDIS